jgi:two-component system phosphate regulon sensor histidine kinase PhoR
MSVSVRPSSAKPPAAPGWIASAAALSLAVLAAAAWAAAWPDPLIAALTLGCGIASGFILQTYRGGAASPAVDTDVVPAQPNGTSLTAIDEVVQALDIPAIVLDSQRRIMAFNRHAADLFPAVSQGDPLAVVSRHPDLLQSIERVSARGQTETAEITERMLQGRRFIVTSSPLPVASLLLLQFRDTSEQERLAQLRADFIANASHELRTPLASIRGFIETLEGSARNDEAARIRFLSIMATQAARMNRILDDLLSLSRIEMRAHLRPENKVDLAELAAHVVHGMEPLAARAEIRLHYQAPATPSIVRGDKDELEQVMQNLVHNAIKYGRQGGTVDVTIDRRAATKVTRAACTVSVRDDGPGIPPEHLPRLTERFYRVDTARSREQGGTGLGLAIVKHILNRHRGELEITSEVGRGSQFTVILDSVAG